MLKIFTCLTVVVGSYLAITAPLTVKVNAAEAAARWADDDYRQHAVYTAWRAFPHDAVGRNIFFKKVWVD